jgi:hypothetical protein
MTMTVDLTPQIEAWINAEAKRRGLLPVDLVRRVIEERAAAPPAPPQTPAIDTGRDPTIALMQAWLSEDATDDPQKIRAAEEELITFKRNMNAPRKEAGERLLFPEVE